MASQLAEAANAGVIPLQVLHRVAAMARGGMDTPHNGAVITLLVVTGQMHRQFYGHIFVLAGLKTLAVFWFIVLRRWFQGAKLIDRNCLSALDHRRQKALGDGRAQFQSAIAIGATQRVWIALFVVTGKPCAGHRWLPR